mmetsp:Transcript_2736/g.8307  ORF Transcript_2736/g.8307 Transcript_2736/m.8307 type:complete len:231 (+) Transcript_2736:691-1383(+)
MFRSSSSTNSCLRNEHRSRFEDLITSPFEGSSWPAIIFSWVVFPQPFCPTRPTRSPVFTSQVTLLRTSAFLKVWPTSSSRTYTNFSPPDRFIALFLTTCARFLTPRMVKSSTSSARCSSSPTTSSSSSSGAPLSSPISASAVSPVSSLASAASSASSTGASIEGVLRETASPSATAESSNVMSMPPSAKSESLDTLSFLPFLSLPFVVFSCSPDSAETPGRTSALEVPLV